MAGLYDGISAYFTARSAQKAKVKEARNELSDINTQLVNLRKRYMALPYSDPEKAELSSQIQELSAKQKEAQSNLDNEKVQLKTVDSTNLGKGSTLGEYGAKVDTTLNKGVAKAWDNTKEVAKNVGQGIKDSTKYIGSSIGDAVNASLNKTTDPRSKGERAQADIADQNAADEQKAAQREAQEGNRDERDVAAQDAAARQAQKAEAVQHQLGASAGAGAAALAGAEAVMGENMNIEQQRNYQAGRRDTGYQHQAAQRSAQAGAAALRGGADARDAFASELSNENAKRSMLTNGYYDEAPTSNPQDVLPKTPETPTPKEPETPTQKEKVKEETVVEETPEVKKEKEMAYERVAKDVKDNEKEDKNKYETKVVPESKSGIESLGNNIYGTLPPLKKNNMTSDEQAAFDRLKAGHGTEADAKALVRFTDEQLEKFGAIPNGALIKEVRKFRDATPVNKNVLSGVSQQFN